MLFAGVRTGAVVLASSGMLMAQAKTFQWAGYEWNVRGTGFGGPGPNYWDERNAWVDRDGRLRLRLAQRDSKWVGAEVLTTKRLGFGRYEFEVQTRLDSLDRNVVLGIFNYPTSDVGSDGTHEIDIEFARWGSASNLPGNFTVWPVQAALKQTTHPFAFDAKQPRTTHVFDWGTNRIEFAAYDGRISGGRPALASWTYAPANPAQRISQKPMPLHLNLWCFSGKPPVDGQDVEVVFSSFRFDPKP